MVNSDLQKTKEDLINKLRKKQNTLTTLLQEGLIDENTYLSKMQHLQQMLHITRSELAFIKEYGKSKK